jgi:hypothetical protein
LSIHGRPPLGCRRGAGSRGSILAHCLPVSRTLRRATAKTSKTAIPWSLRRHSYPKPKHPHNPVRGL